MRANMKPSVIRFAAAGLLALVIAAALHAQPMLLAHWRFENNGEDASGNGFTATLKGKASYSDDAMEGQASLLLNGTSDYASVGPFNFGDQFTIAAWVFLEYDAADIRTLIANCAGGSRVDGFKVYVNSWSTSDRAILVETSDGVNRTDALTPIGVFEYGLWMHLAVAMDKTNGVAEIYLDGEPRTQSNSIMTNFQVTKTVTIGVMPGPSWFWKGMIDDVRIYQGVLTEGEIIDVMNATSAVEEQDGPTGIFAPDGFRLEGVYPNPFNPDTRIAYRLPETGPVRLEVFNLLGRRVAVLVDGVEHAGVHETWFHADRLPSGMYVCRLAAGGRIQTGKMMLLK